nr:DapH/DapD/GlmU-related protein [uncultured Cellulosilyticum sp.]
MKLKFIHKLISRIRGQYPIEDLLSRGLTVGSNFTLQQGCIIDESFCWLISIGDRVSLAPNVHILAHDASTKNYLGYAKIGEVIIGNDVFVGAGTIILPQVHIGNRVIIGAGSVVTKNIADNCVVCGNPARVISTVDDYIEKNKILFSNRPHYNATWTLNHITTEQKQIMKQDLKDGIGYIE